MADAQGQVEFTTPGTYQWEVPVGVTSICVVCVGGGGGGIGGAGGTAANAGGGGGGGALSYKNNYAVTIDQSLTVTVGNGGDGGLQGSSNSNRLGTDGEVSSLYIGTTAVCSADYGRRGEYGDNPGLGGTIKIGDGGGNGGNGGSLNDNVGSGGGGAGGYSGDGGKGADRTESGSAGNGGGGGGGGRAGNSSAGSGGGVGIYGEGASGAGGSSSDSAAAGGRGGSNGSNGTQAQAGSFGGGGGSADDTVLSNGGNGGNGAVRIIWGPGRAFPSTLTEDQTPVVPLDKRIEPTDLFLVNDGATSYSVQAQNFAGYPEHLVLVQLDNGIDLPTSYTCRAELLKSRAAVDQWMLVQRGTTSHKVEATVVAEEWAPENVAVNPYTLETKTYSETSVSITVPVNIAAGSTVVFLCVSRQDRIDSGGTYTLTDNKNNNWQSVIQGDQANGLTDACIFKATISNNLQVNDSLTVSCNPASNQNRFIYSQIFVIPYVSDAVVVDTNDFRFGAATAQPSLTGGKLIVAVSGTGSTTTKVPTETNRWIYIDPQQQTQNGNQGYMYYVENISGLFTDTITMNDSANYSGVAASFNW